MSSDSSEPADSSTCLYMWGSVLMECVNLQIQRPAFLSNHVQSWHDESVSQANNKLSNPTIHKRGCHGFVFYSWWQGGTVGHPLSCCNCCFHTITCLKSVNCNPSFTACSFPLGILFFFHRQNKERGGERETCVLSFSRIKMPQKWKMKETNTTECQSII